jgi:hypothetical protein
MSMATKHENGGMAYATRGKWSVQGQMYGKGGMGRVENETRQGLVKQKGGPRGRGVHHCTDQLSCTRLCQTLASGVAYGKGLY